MRFSGYKHPHPLENDIIVKIHTTSATQPTAALASAAARLEGEYRSLLADFRDAAERIGREAEQLG